MKKNAYRWAPFSTAGKWSLRLIVAMFLLLVAGSLATNWLYGSVPGANTLSADLAARPALALTMAAGIACGVAAFLTGGWAVAREGERSVAVFLATAIGAFLLLFVAGEWTSP